MYRMQSNERLGPLSYENPSLIVLHISPILEHYDSATKLLV